MKETIGWIGTGVMGAPMAAKFLDAGHTLVVYNRTPAKAETLIQAGARSAKNPAELAAECDVVFTMVGYPEDVQASYFGPQGIFQAARLPAYLIDMTSAPPELARRIANRAAEGNCQALDAPVSGGDLGARNGTLAIMVGGDADAFARLKPKLALMGQAIEWMGPAGAGQSTKVSNQILVAGNMIGMCESLLFAVRAGLNAEQVIAVIGKGAAGSWAINNLGPRILAQDFAPGFYIEHFVKDMGIALSECERMNLSLPGLALVRQLYIALKARGAGRSGTQALYQVLADLNGMA